LPGEVGRDLRQLVVGVQHRDLIDLVAVLLVELLRDVDDRPRVEARGLEGPAGALGSTRTPGTGASPTRVRAIGTVGISTPTPRSAGPAAWRRESAPGEAPVPGSRHTGRRC
jgi:hypothetical protein